MGVNLGGCGQRSASLLAGMVGEAAIACDPTSARLLPLYDISAVVGRLVFMPLPESVARLFDDARRFVDQGRRFLDDARSITGRTT